VRAGAVILWLVIVVIVVAVVVVIVIVAVIVVRGDAVAILVVIVVVIVIVVAVGRIEQPAVALVAPVGATWPHTLQVPSGPMTPMQPPLGHSWR